MIAKVRIAPVEQWCEYYLNRFEEVTRFVQPGMEVPIIPSSCAVDPPDLDRKTHAAGFKWWRLTEEFVEASGKPPKNCYICEHMLEMD